MLKLTKYAGFSPNLTLRAAANVRHLARLPNSAYAGIVAAFPVLYGGEKIVLVFQMIVR